MIKSTQFVVNDMIVDFCGQKYHLKQESAKNSRNPIPSGRVLVGKSKIRIQMSDRLASG